MFKTVDEYIAHLPEDRQNPVFAIREAILKNLPEGFQEIMTGDMISYVVPHTIYPAGYHCNPEQPLPFMSIVSNKNFISFYHMGLYAHEPLMHWFEASYREACKYKLDMGKSCVRFKRMDDIPYELIGHLVSKMSVGDWIALYEAALSK